MTLRILVRGNYSEKSTVSIKFHNFHSFKKRVILLCQSILETRQISHLYASALWTIPLKEVSAIYRKISSFKSIRVPAVFQKRSMTMVTKITIFTL